MPAYAAGPALICLKQSRRTSAGPLKRGARARTGEDHMEAVTSYLREVSVLDGLASDLSIIVAGFALLVINLSLTFVHVNEERSGRLWDYLGYVEGVKVPDPAGVLLFFVLLTPALWILGIASITGRLPILDVVLQSELALAGVGAMIGVRISDSLYSHLWLSRQYRRYANNPGLRSVPLCLAEAALLAVVFAPGSVSSLLHAGAAGMGFLAGWVFFASIRPGLRSLRSVERLRQERWIPETD